MKIYTKTGDKGMTSLFGGKRVWKDDLRIDAYGSVDEINSFLGLAITEISDESIKAVLRKIQNDLFVVGSDLASPREAEKPNSKVTRVDASFFETLENEIDKFNSDLPDLKHFILPGGTKGASFLHAARTICRRAERNVIKLSKNENIGENILIYLNRLSDFLFVLARYENHISQTPDVEWKGS
ncbi:MAG: cob(I)yrinic acid a,c-diamide adenosyltransferase [Melioribacteraceae bacterium]|nr:cob(I)yrinic acid a,c-diamide adenosyltransferase [Melioribacteraceae bacterium]